MPTDPLRDAIVVYANYAQFAPGQTIHSPRVESRMLLWCKAGQGVVTVNGLAQPFEPGRYLVLPWAHQIRYVASRSDPFLLAGIHLIPRHQRRVSVRYEVAHDPRHALAGAAARQDLPIAGLEGLRQGRFQAPDPLPQLAEYIVRVFLRGQPSEDQARQLGRLLLRELVMAGQAHEARASGLPVELEQMTQYILFHLQEPLSLSHLVAFSRLSPATIGRMFRRHLRTTPVTWILRVKIDRARELLRTRRLSVEEVGRAVGIADPYYFSKCFRRVTGQSPRDYRRGRQWL